MTETTCMTIEDKDKVLVIKLPYYIKPSKREEVLKELINQKEKGVILLPYGAEVSYISNDTVIAVEDAGKNRCLEGVTNE